MVITSFLKTLVMLVLALAVGISLLPSVPVHARSVPSVTALSQQPNQWRQLTQFDEGSVLSLFASGGRVYAGTAFRGVFVSTDNGKTWNEANTGMGNRAIRMFVSFGGAIFAGGVGGVFQTTNGGQSWALLGLRDYPVTDFAVFGNVLVAATTRGLFRSIDGIVWTQIGADLPTQAINAVEVFNGSLVIGTNVGVFRSSNAGQNWTVDNLGLPNNGQPNVFSLAAIGHLIYLGTFPYRDAQNFQLPQVYIWGNSGPGWLAMNSPLVGNSNGSPTFSSTVSSFFIDDLEIYACSASLFNLSARSWEDLALTNSTLPLPIQVNTAVRAGNSILIGTDRGIFSLSTVGQSWQPSSKGLKAANATIKVSGENLIAYTQSGLVFVSADNGQNWTETGSIPLSSSGRRREIQGFAVFNNAWYVVTFDGAVYRSTDNGKSWVIFTGSTVAAFNVSNGIEVINGKLYAFFNRALYRLNDGGNDWVTVSNALNVSGIITSVRLAANGTNFYLVAGKNLYRSTDAGSTFTQVTLGNSTQNINCVTVDGVNVLAGTATGVFISSDNGQSWSQSKTNLIVNDIVRYGNQLYVGTPTGVFFSSNNGVNWTQATTGMTSRSINNLAVKGDTLLAGTIGGSVFAAVNPSTQLAALASVSAASYTANAELAPESIVAAFGANLANGVQASPTTPLTTLLTGTSVIVRDSLGIERRAPLFFVSPDQVNYQMPAGTAAGRVTVIIASGDGSVSAGEVTTANVAPSLFAANSNGQGIAAAVLLRVKADGSQSYEAVAKYDQAQGTFVAKPIEFGGESEQLFLILYGTGIRFRSGLPAVTATIGGERSEALFAGETPGFVGLDQVNLRLSRSLSGRGVANVMLSADGKISNVVLIEIR